MNIVVFKDNQSVSRINLGTEVIGNLESDLTFYIGRSADCHVHLDDKQISREHAEINYSNGKWSIKQLSPFSNVIVNGSSCEDTELFSGDIIKIGPFVMNVNIEALGPGSEKEFEKNEEGDSEKIAEEVSEEQSESDEDDTVALGADDSFDNENSEETLDENFEAPDEEVFGDEEGEEGGEYEVEAFGGDADDVGDRTQVIQTFSKIELEIFGEFAPYEKYTLDDAEVLIGRDPEKCNIVLNDQEVSSVHASINKNNIVCILEDLDSGNGTLLNGERINKSVLTNNDEIVIGGTTFTVKVISDFLDEEESRLMPVEENQVIEVEEIVEVDADFVDGDFDDSGEGGGSQKTGLVADLKNFKNLPPERRKKIIYIGVGLILLLLFLMDTDTKKKTVKKAKAKTNRIGSDKKKKIKEELAKLTDSEIEFVESRYLLAKELMRVGKFRELIEQINKIHSLVPEFKQSKQLLEQGKVELAKLEEEERKMRAEIASKKRLAKVKILVDQAKESIQANQVIRARSLFSEILALDPENFDVPILKAKIEAYERKIDKENMLKEQAKAERQREEALLAPGKSYYINKEWYKAILKLKGFVKKTNIDDDLMKEGVRMFSESKANLANIIDPLLGKARSLKEGQDLKGAYESFSEALKYDPSNIEALDESSEINERLSNRSRKIYREAIIAESLSLFEDAKEKFQEVQQVSPSDSEYYKKASKKLKDYLD